MPRRPVFLPAFAPTALAVDVLMPQGAELRLFRVPCIEAEWRRCQSR